MTLLRGDPFRRLTICGVFRRSVEVFTADPVTFLSIGVIGALPGVFTNWLILSKARQIPDFDDMTDPEAVDEEVLEATVALIGPLLLLFILATVVGIMLKVATIRSTIQIYVGRQPLLTQDMKHGLSLCPRMCCLQLALLCGIMFLALVFGLFIGFLSLLPRDFIGEDGAAALVALMGVCAEVTVLYFFCTLILWDTALVVEGLPEFQPFFRSYELVKGQCCFVFCALLLEGLALLALILANDFLFGGLGSTAIVIAQSLTHVVLTPYTGIFLTVIYVNSRIKKQEEECNSTILIQEMMPDTSEGTGSYVSMHQLEQETPEVQLDAPLLDKSEEQV